MRGFLALVLIAAAGCASAGPAQIVSATGRDGSRALVIATDWVNHGRPAPLEDSAALMVRWTDGCDPVAVTLDERGAPARVRWATYDLQLTGAGQTVVREADDAWKEHERAIHLRGTYQRMAIVGSPAAKSMVRPESVQLSIDAVTWGRDAPLVLYADGSFYRGPGGNTLTTALELEVNTIIPPAAE